VSEALGEFAGVDILVNNAGLASLCGFYQQFEKAVSLIQRAREMRSR